VRSAILLLSCPDRRGLVARLAAFIAGHKGNILHADHHIDAESSLFLSRIEWDLGESDLPPDAIAAAFEPLGREIEARWTLEISGDPKRIAIWVTREAHCLLDLIWRMEAGDLPCEIPLIISNRTELEPIARSHGVEFRHFAITPENRGDQETAQLAALKEQRIDLVALAKYMQILSPSFLEAAPPIINIHHSFLPAFPGANPYRQAFDRGVKIIGATAHYVTAELDEGPIIDQETTRVSHRDGVHELMRRGRDLERGVLARAVRAHLESRVLRYRNKTVVFL
jgi:formyltetrahydrofolate deformylase